jgi:diguanylate cyclase (GGDEF)-like protein
MLPEGARVSRLSRWLKLALRLTREPRDTHSEAALKNKQAHHNTRNSLLVGAVMLSVGLVLLMNNLLLAAKPGSAEMGGAYASYRALYIAMVALGFFLLVSELSLQKAVRTVRLAFRGLAYGGIVVVMLLISAMDYRLYRDFAPFLLAQLFISMALSLPFWLYPIINGIHLGASLFSLKTIGGAPFLEDRVWLLPAIYCVLAIAVGLSTEAVRRRAWLAEAELAHANEELRASSFLDPLTGLYNRRYFSEIFSSVSALARRGSGELCVIMMDADHFKDFNDSYGHIAGDRALVGMARIIRESIRASDIAARFGGEEFLVLLPNTGLAGAEQVAERILASLRVSLVEGIGRAVSASAGLALMTDGDTELSLLERADKALYQAKRSGRDRLCVNAT